MKIKGCLYDNVQGNGGKEGRGEREDRCETKIIFATPSCGPFLPFIPDDLLD